MRQKMRDHLLKRNASLFDIKQGVGGMADIEFLTQFWVLNNAYKTPDISLYSDNIRILEQAEKYNLISELERQN